MTLKIKIYYKIILNYFFRRQDQIHETALLRLKEIYVQNHHASRNFVNQTEN